MRRLSGVLLIASLVGVLAGPAVAEQTLLVRPGAPGSPRPDPLGGVASVIKAGVEATRGLQPLADVPIRIIGQREAAADLLEPLEEEDIETIRAEEALLKRIGLLPAQLDLLATVEGLLEAQVGGYYRPAEGDIAIAEVLLDQEHDAALRWVLAHEYAHALQDQHFGIEAVKDAAAPGDGRSAVIALAEGEAVFLTVEMARCGALPASPTATDHAALSDVTDPVVLPPLMLREMVFPYLDGPDFVGHFWDVGGWPAIDALWRDPPSSTEQVMHPALYPDEQPVPIRLPDVAGQLGGGWTAGFETTMGELRVGVFVADDESIEVPLTVPVKVTLPNAEAAAGWAGDRIVTVDGPTGEWVVVWQTVWDTALDADEFAAAAVAALDGLVGVHVVRDGVGVVVPPHGDRSVLLLVADRDTTMFRLTDALSLERG